VGTEWSLRGGIGEKKGGGERKRRSGKAILLLKGPSWLFSAGCKEGWEEGKRRERRKEEGPEGKAIFRIAGPCPILLQSRRRTGERKKEEERRGRRKVLDWRWPMSISHLLWGAPSRYSGQKEKRKGGKERGGGGGKTSDSTSGSLGKDIPSFICSFTIESRRKGRIKRRRKKACSTLRLKNHFHFFVRGPGGGGEKGGGKAVVAAVLLVCGYLLSCLVEE